MRALEHWIPMWCPTDSCMVLRLLSGGCLWLPVPVQNRKRKLLNSMCVGAFMTNYLGIRFTPSNFIGALKEMNCIEFDWTKHRTDFKPNLLMILVWKFVLQLKPKLHERNGCIWFFLALEIYFIFCNWHACACSYEVHACCSYEDQ